MISNLESVLLQFLPFDDLEHRLALGAHDRVPTKRIEVNSLGQHGRNLRRRHHCREWRTIADALSHGHNVRNNSLQLEAPEILSCAAEPSLHFVSDANTACSAHVFIC